MALDILHKIIVFIAVLGILIAFHEFGHFWVARKLGVKVLRYSIGFGKPLLRYRSGPQQTEYVIAALPLGGYVKMLDEREGPVDAADYPFAFNRQPVWKRIAIVVAGPLFNLILAVGLFALVFAWGVPALQPVVAEPAEDTQAWHAGIRGEDTVIALEGQSVSAWSEFRLRMIALALERASVELRLRDKHDQVRSVNLSLSGVDFLQQHSDPLHQLGLRVWEPVIATAIGRVDTTMPAYRAGLRAGDVITAVDGVAVTHWRELVDVVSARAGEEVVVHYQREGLEKTASVVLQGVSTRQGVVGRLGVAPLQRDVYARYRTTLQYSPLLAFWQGFLKTWDMSILTLKMIGKIVTGEASLKNISGPISIAQYAGESAKIGVLFLLDFMAVISVSLGVLNLLPIPMLDGGHLLYYLIEVVKGSPVSEKYMLLGQKMGLALLLMLMTVAFYNDILRILA